MKSAKRYETTKLWQTTTTIKAIHGWVGKSTLRPLAFNMFNKVFKLSASYCNARYITCKMSAEMPLVSKHLDSSSAF